MSITNGLIDPIECDVDTSYECRKGIFNLYLETKDSYEFLDKLE
jgi:hypothetical protein